MTSVVYNNDSDDVGIFCTDFRKREKIKTTSIQNDSLGCFYVIYHFTDVLYFIIGTSSGTTNTSFIRISHGEYAF